MIHEALLYLWNCPGRLYNSNGEEEWFNMFELKDVLHPGERRLLQRIMYIALDHHQIQEFIKMSHKNYKGDVVVVQDAENLQEGLYLRAFCNGLDAVLEDYRNDIVELERTILKDPQLPLTFVLSGVEKYATLFDAIKSMIRVVKTERLHGCLLMGRLHSYSNCGIKQVADATEKIICFINTVFYRHLCNWIIFGDLTDVHDEFFICDGKCPDEDFLWPVSLNESSNELESFKSFRIKRPPKIRKFYLRDHLVPSNITLELAETILFIGRMVWIIRNDPSQANDDKLKLKLNRDIWDEKQTYYFKKIRELENRPFNLAQFEKVIEECRMCLTKYLWTIMVEEAKLFEHLQLLRDYYALGRGELFQQFIISSQEKLTETPDDYIALKLNAVFNETVKRMYSESDKTYKRFELLFPKGQQQSSTFYPSLQIQMNFEIVWPLHIIFHPAAMVLYNKLFNFLMRVKKTQINLDKLWQMHMEGKRKIHHGVWALRNTLMYIINSLQYYLQVDVIEAQFAVLIKSVTNAKNLENIIKLHAEFLGNLMSRTFLMMLNDKTYKEQKNQLYKQPLLNYELENPVHKTLLVFLKLCDTFCAQATTWGIQLTEIEEQELSQLQSQCNLLVDHLLEMLYSLREHTSGTHLLQLLHQIDFNRWFSKHKPGFNLCAA